MKIKVFSLKLIAIGILPLILSYSVPTVPTEAGEITLYCEYTHSPAQSGFVKSGGPINTDSGSIYQPLKIRDPDCSDIERDIAFYPGQYDLPLAPPGGFVPGGPGGSWNDCTSCNPVPASVVAEPWVEAKFIDLATRWFGPEVGSPRLDMYDDVITAAEAAGMDPIFALSIWLHESGASNYEGICTILGGGNPSSGYCTRILDFGVNLDAIATYIHAPGHFPDDVEQDHFQEQLDHFMNLPAWYLTMCDVGVVDCPMDVFGAMFAAGGCPPATPDGYSPGIRVIYEDFFGAGAFPCYPINL